MLRVLFVSPYLPSRIRVRPFHWIHALAGLGCRVHLVTLMPPEDRWASDAPLRDVCVAIDRFPLSRVRTLTNAAHAVATGAPLQASYSRHAAASHHVARLAASGEFDVVHVEHLRGTALASGVRTVPVIFDAVDSISLLFEQAAALAPGRLSRVLAQLDLARTRRFEARAPRQFARTLVTSARERDAFIRLAGPDVSDRLAVLPNGVDLDYFKPTHEPIDTATVLFSGKLSYHANRAAALRLVRGIMPRVWATRPDVRVVLAGKDPSPALTALAADPRVSLTGFVEDLRPHVARASIAVAPLVYGAGIQNKVLEAMACGVPVVTSVDAAQALSARAGQDLLVADSDEAFARDILGLLDDEARRQAIGRAGRAYVEAYHDWNAQGRRLQAIYEDVLR